MNTRIRAAALMVFIYSLTPLRALSYGEGFKSYRDIQLAPEVPASNGSSTADGIMRADADEIATLFKVHALADAIRGARNTGTTPLPRSIQQARLLCLYKLMIASEEVRKTIATIDYEVSNSNENLNSLVAKRAMTSNLLTTVNFTQGGSMGTIKQSLAFPGGSPSYVRQEIAMASFGTSIALSLVNLLSAGAWHRQIDSAPNSLAEIFDASRQPGDANQSYLWKFLNSPVPGSADKLTRKAILLKHFEKLARLDPDDDLMKSRLAATPSTEKELNESIKVLNRRITLLHDLKTHVEEFDGSLFEFHKAIAFD